MTIILLLLVLLCFYQMKAAPKNEYFTDYLSKDKTLAIKGIFVALVFLRHFEQYVTLKGAPHQIFLVINKYSSQLIVVMFLFYSGYGVSSALAKKEGYRKAMPRKKIGSLLLRFDVVVLIYLLVSALLGRTYKIKTVIGAFFGWESVGNSSWYIFAILIAYAATFFGFTLAKDDRMKGILYTTVLLVIYSVIVSALKEDAPRYYNTILCYPLGMFYYEKQGEIERLIQKNKGSYAASLSGSCALFCVCAVLYFKTEIMAFYMAAAVLFGLMTVIFTMRIQICNKPLAILGNYVFEVYILQRLPMMVFQRSELLSGNVYVYFVLCAAVTALLSYAYKKIE